MERTRPWGALCANSFGIEALRRGRTRGAGSRRFEGRTTPAEGPCNARTTVRRTRQARDRPPSRFA